MLHITETRIVVPGREREAVLLHATDLHLTEADGRDVEAMSYAGKYTESFDRRAPEGPRPVSRKQYLDEIVRTANRLHADAVVFTGDMMHYPSAANLDAFAEAVGRLDAPYLYTLGNHDWHFPHLDWNERTRAQYYPRFLPFSRERVSVQVMEIAGVRLIALDNSNYQIDDDQWNAVEPLLHSAVPYLMFFHIPLFLPRLAEKTIENWKAPILMDASGWTEEQRQKWQVGETNAGTRALVDALMNNRSGSLHGVFSGHVHFEHEETLPGGGRQYVTNPGFTACARIVRLVPSPDTNG